MVSYQQVNVTTMGTRMAPSFVNLFMGKLEREFLLTPDVKSREWWRFIDDIFPFGRTTNHHYEILLRASTVTTPPANLLLPGQHKKSRFRHDCLPGKRLDQN